MKTFVQSLAVSIAVYTALFILIASIAFGSEVTKSSESSVNSVSELAFEFEEEEYIDDIPFNTNEIALNYLYEKNLNMEFDFEEEAYVDDIPFNTNEIATLATEHYALGK